MAVTRPWITPEDVKNYTSHKDVAEASRKAGLLIFQGRIENYPPYK